ncbi:hypothetical protein F5X99DRAFT_430791 [Biscogniauxia marginata]|nr:hypothetical protein F5X99DRAFT_430791 [Biscogniauxia marginata]
MTNTSVMNLFYLVNYRPVAIDYRHVQLALKYTRTQSCKYQGYLQALLRPRHGMSFRPSDTPYWGSSSSESSRLLKAKYSFCPKIITGPDGQLRFLLLSTWRYKYKHRGIAITRETLGTLAICPHASFCDDFSQSRHYGHIEVLESAVDEALEKAQNDQHNDAEVVGACPRCPTDFAVRATTEYVEVCAWHDIGTEGFPTDLSWRIHVMRLDVWVQNFDCLGPVVQHYPGSIRTLFESEQEVRSRRRWRWNKFCRMWRFWAPVKVPGNAPVTPIGYLHNNHNTDPGMLLLYMISTV